LFTAASRLSLPLAEGKSQQPFYCRATHSRGTRVIEVSNPGPGASSEAASVSLYPPSQEEFQGPYRNSSLLCQIHHGRRQPPAPIRWLKNGSPVQDGVTTETASLANGRMVTNSRLVVTEAEWEEGTVYTCQAGTELRNTSKAQECG
ncbi:IGHM protein, partial [Halcyon senegalensis]|nr:IGHM protein [Halcyon senegalensis]